MMADLTPAQFADIVSAGIAEGLGDREIARQLTAGGFKTHHSRVGRERRRQAAGPTFVIQHHHDAAPTAALAKRRAAPEPAQPTPAEGIRELLDTAVKVGNAAEVTAYTRALAALQGMGEAFGAEPVLDDWSALSDVEASALAYLTAKARGEPLDPEGQWWQALIARVPERPYLLHPSRVRLPEGAPQPPQYYVPEPPALPGRT